MNLDRIKRLPQVDGVCIYADIVIKCDDKPQVFVNNNAKQSCVFFDIIAYKFNEQPLEEQLRRLDDILTGIDLVEAEKAADAAVTAANSMYDNIMIYVKEQIANQPNDGPLALDMAVLMQNSMTAVNETQMAQDAAMKQVDMFNLHIMQQYSTVYCETYTHTLRDLHYMKITMQSLIAVVQDLSKKLNQTHG